MICKNVFNLATILDGEEVISEYLSQVLADGDELLRAIGYIAKARGMAQSLHLPDLVVKAYIKH